MNKSIKGYLTNLSDDDVICEADSILSIYGIDYSNGYVYCGESNECYSEVADIFCNMLGEFESNLRTALESGNIVDYTVYVHGLKGNARSLGANKLADIAYEHELKGKASDITYCREHWDSLYAEWIHIIHGLHNYLWAMGMYDGDMDWND